jgi:hypothetical protein
VQTDQVALIVSGIAACVGLYGAVNSRRALGWQRRRDEELRSVKLEVLCEQRTDVVASSHELPREETRGYRLIVSIVNASEQATVYVSEVLMRSPVSDEGTFLQTQEPDVCLQPRARMTRKLWIDKHQTEFFPDLRYVIEVTLASGATYTSGEFLFDADAVEEAELAKQRRGGNMIPEDWPMVSSITFPLQGGPLNPE